MDDLKQASRLADLSSSELRQEYEQAEGPYRFGSRPYKSGREANMLVDVLLFTLAALSAIVAVEPSPFDLFATSAIFLRILTRGSVPSKSRFALQLAAGFSAMHLFMIPFAESTARAAWYAGVTLYLAALWATIVTAPRTLRVHLVGPLMYGYVTAAVLSTAVGTLAFLNLIPGHDLLLQAGRPQALFKDPNVFGAYCVPPALFALYREITTRSSSRKVFWFALFSVCSLGVVISFSRGAIINWLIALFAVIIFNLRKRRVLKSLAGIVALGILGLILSTVAIDYQPFHKLLNERQGILHSYDVTDRIPVQQQALNGLKEHPLGIGPGQAEGTFNLATHSLYLRVLSENGAIGGSIFIIFFLCSISSVLGKASAGAAANFHSVVTAPALLGIAVNSLVIDSLHWRHMWFLLALAYLPLEVSDQARSRVGSGRRARWNVYKQPVNTAAV
jgi:O-antigen ligase